MSTPPVRRRSILNFEPDWTTDPLSSSSKPRDRFHDRTISSLNNAVQLIGLVNNFLTPIPLAKEVLGSIAAILDIIKTTYTNHGDFKDVAEQCQNIALIIWKATNGPSEYRADERVQHALSTLQSSVNNIRDTVREKAKSKIVSKVFHSTLNKETIGKWKADLNHCLLVFNTELNITTNAKLDEFFDWFERQPSRNDSMPNEIPPRPVTFFGRDDIVQDTVKQLITCSKVALIGTGGIGKTSIARAVLNDDGITAKFQQQRFFVRFDDMDASQVTFATFLDRIARALGNASVNAYNEISRTIAKSETLLVLDNAESFLDAPIHGGRIADAIDEFGARPNVAILLTTRTTVLPPNLNWIRSRVLSLEEDAACKAFKMFYSPPIESSTLVKLLADIDFHPLSINLLAQTAVQNQWSADDLAEEWNRQRVSLLGFGAGKIQSLAATIETSLNSPSIRRFGDIIRHFLQIIAFLPQGVRKGTLGLVNYPSPMRVDVESCIDPLCRQSLAYRDGDFITVLAPIRLYMTSIIPISENPLFKGFLSYHTEFWTLFSAEDDLNIERIYTHWLSSGTAREDALQNLTWFIRILQRKKPRPISAIQQVVTSLDYKNLASSSSSSMAAALRVLPYIRNRREIAFKITKAACLATISRLMLSIGHTSEAKESLEAARTTIRGIMETHFLHRLLAHEKLEALLTSYEEELADIHVAMGNYQAAEELLQSLLERMISESSRLRYVITRSRRNYHGYDIHNVRRWIFSIQMIRGKHGMSREFLKYLPPDLATYFRALWVTSADGKAELHSDLDLLKEQCQHKKDFLSMDSLPISYLTTLSSLAEVTYRRGEKMEWSELHAQALDIASKAQIWRSSWWDSFYYEEKLEALVIFLSVISCYLAIGGTIEQARELLGKCKSDIDARSHRPWDTVICLYAAGCIELHAEDFSRAEEYFRQSKEISTTIQEFRFRTLSERALGEIAIKKGDMVAAKAHFEATSKLCETTGMWRNELYYGFYCFKPRDEVYDGWERYIREDHTVFDLQK